MQTFLSPSEFETRLAAEIGVAESECEGLGLHGVGEGLLVSGQATGCAIQEAAAQRPLVANACEFGDGVVEVDEGLRRAAALGAAKGSLVQEVAAFEGVRMALEALEAFVEAGFGVYVAFQGDEGLAFAEQDFSTLVGLDAVADESSQAAFVVVEGGFWVAFQEGDLAAVFVDEGNLCGR